LTSSSDLPQEWIQVVTFSVNSEDGQKQPASLLESHLGTESQVFKHLGTNSGQGAGTMDELGMAGLVMVVGLGGASVERSVGPGGHTVVEATYVEVTTVVE
jgi:hypothetical protein